MRMTTIDPTTDRVPSQTRARARRRCRRAVDAVAGGLRRGVPVSLVESNVDCLDYDAPGWARRAVRQEATQ